MTEQPHFEQRILDEVFATTGLRFVKVGGIDARDQAIADAVLPILARWVPRASDPIHRWSLYACFHTPFARPFLSDMIEWWKAERYALAIECLTQVLTLIAKPQDGEGLWAAFLEAPPSAAQYSFLSKLAGFPAVSDAVVARLLHALNAEDLGISDLRHISQIRDPRIRHWFIDRKDSRNPTIRSIAARLQKGPPRLPKGLFRSSSGPDLRGELFSTEVDIAEGRALLDKLACEFGVAIASPLRSLRFLGALDIDCWVMAPVVSQGKEPAELWFRLEDVDVVEITLVKAQQSGQLQ